MFFFFSSRRRHTRCALVTGVQTCALPICRGVDHAVRAESDRARLRPLPVWRAVGRAGADPWRGKRALCPLWRGVAGADPRLLLLARQPAVAGRTQGGLGRAGAAHGPWWGETGCGYIVRRTSVSRG